MPETDEFQFPNQSLKLLLVLSPIPSSRSVENLVAVAFTQNLSHGQFVGPEYALAPSKVFESSRCA